MNSVFKSCLSSRSLHPIRTPLNHATKNKKPEFRFLDRRSRQIHIFREGFFSKPFSNSIISSISHFSLPVRRSALAKEDALCTLHFALCLALGTSPAELGTFFHWPFPSSASEQYAQENQNLNSDQPLAKRDTSLDMVRYEADAIRAFAREGKVGETNPQN